jgi:hypothetical protein
VNPTLARYNPSVLARHRRRIELMPLSIMGDDGGNDD